MDTDVSTAASLMAEPTRASMLLKLMNGRALPAGELAIAANISPQTASGHLARLIEGRLLTVERQGRHRYYRLASTEVADALEALLVLSAQTSARTSDAPGTLATPAIGTIAHARTCYAHLAGWLGVRLADALQANGLLLPAEMKAFTVTAAGRAWFDALGVALPASSPKNAAKLARQCLDWTERRPHLGGTLGIALYRRLLDLRWLVSIPNTRSVRVTLEGRRALWERLRVAAG